MNFLTSAKLNLATPSHIFSIQGRASRSEFWWFYLAGVLALFTVGFASVFIMSVSEFAGLSLLIAFALFVQISFFTCSIRRLHDKDKSGWNLLWQLIPILGPLYILFLFLMPGDDEENRFGQPNE